MTRIRASIDAFVLSVVRGRLARPDLADLLAPRHSADGEDGSAAEVRRLRDRLATVEADYDAGLIDGRRYAVASEKTRAELRAVEQARARFVVGAGLAELLGAPNPVAAFDAAPLGSQRAVLDGLIVTTLLPAARGHKFDPQTVRIEWRTQ